MLGVVILMSAGVLVFTGCGWLLEDPPPYPDQGVGGEEMVNDMNEAEMGIDLSENEQELFMIRSSRGE